MSGRDNLGTMSGSPSRPSRVSALAAVLAVAAASTHLAGADSRGAPAPAPTAPSAQQRQAAGDLTRKAIARLGARDYYGAITLYQQAYDIYPEPLLLSNIGAAYYQGGRPNEALDYFCRYLAAAPAGPNATYAQDQIKALRAALTLPARDGAAACEREPAPQAPPRDAPPTVVAPTTVEPPPAPAPVAAPARPGRALRIAGLVSGGVGALATLGGLYYGYVAWDATRQVNDHPPGTPWPADIKQIQADGARAEDRQIGLLVVGGVALAAGGACYWLAGRRDAREPVRVAPIVTPTEAGLAFSGRF